MASTGGPSLFNQPPSFRSAADRAAEQAAVRASRLRIGLFSVGAIGFLVFSMAWNPPVGRVHSFTEASDYSLQRDRGCTNSGEGCHGEESSYGDFNFYHPNTECTDCHDFQGVGCIPCHSPDGHECESCHDGTMEKAGDRTRLTDPYPKGHYRETTHTATGTDMKAVMRAKPAGKAGAACSACHSRDLMASHTEVPQIDGSDYGESVGCGECHNDDRAGGLEQVKSDWKGRGCEDCHTKESSAPMHSPAKLQAAEATDSAGCGSTGDGCHESTDLHALHPNRPTDCSGAGSEGERPCHDLTKQAHQPAERRCGAGGRSCHPNYVDDEYSHDQDAELHRAGLSQATASLFDSVSDTSTPCLACHSMELTEEHSRPGSSLSGNVCLACHDRNETTAKVVSGYWKARNSAGACIQCHGKDDIPSPHGVSGDSHEGVPLNDAGEEADSCSGDVCHEETDVRLLHADAGCTVRGCHQPSGPATGSRTMRCGGGPGDGSCHEGYSTFSGHKAVAGVHRAVEIGTSGKARKGACQSSGCHVSTDLADLHVDAGCEIDGCHGQGDQPQQRSCGGPDESACHTGYSATEHFADHKADRSGTVHGVTYEPGRNGGCFGCHSKDLVVEHTSTGAAVVTGGGATSCRVCHDDSRDPGRGLYAGLSAVEASIERRDVRCVACHASGTDMPNATHAASAHKQTSSALTHSPGSVWADPFIAWRDAMNSPTGGGHNVVSAGVVGARVTKRFPVTTYEFGGRSYVWNLPPNEGPTAWLKPVDGERLTTREEIVHTSIGCDDCHVMTREMAGPHGSAVPILIDPEYSQTEYANPTRGRQSQFEATGTDRVVCMKCHYLSFGSVPGSDLPGGNPVHAQHAKHTGAPSYHPLHYGEKCIDCHVRIPHASRSARMLIRTIQDSRRPADTYPYVSKNHDGLRGVLLRDFTRPQDLTRSACVTGGCHGYHSENDHPLPSDVTTATYWP